jgi:hypothetical protein
LPNRTEAATIILGSERLAQVTGVLNIAYRLPTDDYALQAPWLEDGAISQLSSLAQIARVLTDSVFFPLYPIDSLEAESGFEVQVKVTLISLSVNGLHSPDSTDSGSSSPLRFLFRQFLDLTGYGRREFETRSGVFFPPQIPSR